jgi:hypothetical protein
MMERWQQIESLFQEALQRSPAERDAWLREACRGDCRPASARDGTALCSPDCGCTPAGVVKVLDFGLAKAAEPAAADPANSPTLTSNKKARKFF